MASDTSPENWNVVVQVILGVLGAIGAGFLALYSRATKQHEHTDTVVREGVGAAFVDVNAAKNLERIAQNSDRVVDLLQEQHERANKEEMIQEALKRLKDAKG